MKSIITINYLTGYRDALDSLDAELRQGYSSYWGEEQYEENKWLLERINEKSKAVSQLVADAERTQRRLEERRGR